MRKSQQIELLRVERDEAFARILVLEDKVRVESARAGRAEEKLDAIRKALGIPDWNTAISAAGIRGASNATATPITYHWNTTSGNYPSL